MPRITVIGALLENDGRTVTLATSELSEGVTYTLTVTNAPAADPAAGVILTDRSEKRRVQAATLASASPPATDSPV